MDKKGITFNTSVKADAIMPTKIPIGRPINKSQPLFALTPNLNIYIKVDKRLPKRIAILYIPL